MRTWHLLAGLRDVLPRDARARVGVRQLVVRGVAARAHGGRQQAHLVQGLAVNRFLVVREDRVLRDVVDTSGPASPRGGSRCTGTGCSPCWWASRGPWAGARRACRGSSCTWAPASRRAPPPARAGSRCAAPASAAWQLPHSTFLSRFGVREVAALELGVAVRAGHGRVRRGAQSGAVEVGAGVVGELALHARRARLVAVEAVVRAGQRSVGLRRRARGLRGRRERGPRGRTPSRPAASAIASAREPQAAPANAASRVSGSAIAARASAACILRRPERGVSRPGAAPRDRGEAARQQATRLSGEQGAGRDGARGGSRCGAWICSRSAGAHGSAGATNLPRAFCQCW